MAGIFAYPGVSRMTTARVYANLNRAATQTLGQAGKPSIRRRSVSLQNRQPLIISAACKRDEHSSCYSLNCTCTSCGHRRGA